MNTSSTAASQRPINAIPQDIPLMKVNATNERTRLLCARIERLAEHLVGQAPPTPTTDSVGPTYGGMAGGVERDAIGVNERLSEAEDALTRIEAAWGPF
jgi:hypothetical protein